MTRGGVRSAGILYSDWIHKLSFSNHTDAKGIMDLIRFLSPKHVILVHGEKPKMASLKERIQSELGIQTYFPANCETVYIPSTVTIKVNASDAFIQSCSTPNFKFLKGTSVDKPDTLLENTNTASALHVSDVRVAEGILVMERGEEARIIHQDELPLTFGKEVQFAHCCPVHISNPNESRNRVLNRCKKYSLLQLLFEELSGHFPQEHITNLGEHLQVESFLVSLCLKDSCPYRMTHDVCKKSVAAFFCCTWNATDEKLAQEMVSTMEKICLTEI